MCTFIYNLCKCVYNNHFHHSKFIHQVKHQPQPRLNGSVHRRHSYRHYMYRGSRKRRRMSAIRDNCLLQFWNCVKGSASYKRHRQKTSPEGINSVSRIDSLSRVVFPVAFFTFHVFYWMAYLDQGTVSALFIST
jgi:hypothetical protein